MLFYLIMHFLNPTGESLPNPFVDYSYGIGINICIEIALIGISILMFKIIKSRINKPTAITISTILWFVNYIITWSCFWFEPLALAAGISLIVVIGFDTLCLVGLDLIVKRKQ